MPGRVAFWTSPTGTVTPLERMRIDNLGNVGINTTTQLATLDVRANLGTAPIATFSGKTSFAGLVVDNQGVGDLIVASSSSTVGNLPGRTQFRVTTDGQVVAQSFVDISNPSYFVNPAGGVSMLTSGSVGIGTTSTSNFKLQVAGNIGPDADNSYDLGASPSGRFRNLFLGGGSLHIQCLTSDAGCSSTQGVDYSLSIGNGGTLGIGANVSAVTPADIFLTQGGNVGIGTSAPATSLDVNGQAMFRPGGATGTVMIGTPGGDTGLIWANGATSRADIRYDGVTLKLLNGGAPGTAPANTSGINIATTGYVGIGTTGPLSQLSVGGAGIANTAVYGNGGTSGYGIYGTSGTAVGTAYGVYGNGALSNQASGTAYGVYGTSGGVAGNAYGVYGNASYASSGTAYGVYGTSSNGIGGYFTSGSGYALITGTGNVGIGTTSPGYTLQVNGADTATNGISVTSGSYVNVPYPGNISNATALNSRGFNSTNDNTTASVASGVGIGLAANRAGELLHIKNPGGYSAIFESGNVGIGTTSPVSSLSNVSSITADGIKAVSPLGLNWKIDGAADTYAAIFENVASGYGSGVLIKAGGDKYTGRVLLNVANNDTTSRFIVKGDGTVGIGTTSPGRLLDIAAGTHTYSDYGLVQFTDGTDMVGGIRTLLYDGTIGNSFKSGLVFQTNAGSETFQDRMTIKWDGTVGIATTAPDNTLSVNGTADKASGGTTWGTFSDIRLKNIDGDYTSGLAQIMQLQPVMFHYKPGNALGLPSNEQNYGFIAQDVQKVIPEAVIQSSTGYLSLSADPILWSMVNAIKQQQVEIASLSANLAPVAMTDTGNLSLVDQNVTDTGFTVPHYFTLNNVLGNPITKVDAFAQVVIANLRAGFISAQQISTNALSVATENVTIGGQSLRNYIASIVSDIINQQSLIGNQGYISPIASIDQLHTNFVSPIDNNSNIGLKFGSNQISVIGNRSASGSAVAVIDNAGNASFSGNLTANNLTIQQLNNNGDATISGTLHAGKILADDIVGLHVQAATVSAQYITNVTNVYNSTPSAASNFGLIAGQASQQSSNNNNLTINGGYADISSFSGQFAYVDNLSATTASFSQGLSVFGPTALSDTSIVGQLSISGNFIMANDSINVLGGDLSLQPLRQGGISLMGGLVYFDTDGNIKVGGNAQFAQNVTVKGTLAAGVVSPLPGNDLTVDLSNGTQASGSGIENSKLKIKNSQGSDVLAIDSLGNLIASGTASFGKLNLGLVQPALAVSPTEIIATGSAGTAKITPYQTQVTIDNPLVTSKSLIYITPVGTTFGQNLYLLRQTPDDALNNIKGSFTVGIDSPIPSSVKFNFLIVN